MSANHEVDDEANVRALGVSEKERGKGGARARVGPKLGRLTREKGRGEGREWAAAAGRKRERGEIEPKWLYPFPFPFSFS